MKILFALILLLSFNKLMACEFYDGIANNNSNYLMGKKSKFYDAYKQGKCVLENALKPLPVEQRRLIANLIAKTYKIEN